MAGREQKIGLRAREPVENWMAADTLGNLTEVAGFRLAGGVQVNPAAPLVFESSKTLWDAILEGVDATENRRIELREFCLTEWAPLRPGRFHTERAESARRQAMRWSRIHEDDETAPTELRSAVVRGGGHQRTRIFNPRGKMRMVDGGIGCVRLKPLLNRAIHRWPFGASSTPVVHEGALVLLSDADHDRLIGDVRRFGGVRGTLFGILRFVPRNDITESMFGRGIPQVYIEVFHFEPQQSNHRRGESIDVTAAVTFTSRSGQYPGLNVSYVTFDAANRSDLARALDWIERIYVGEAYSGTIITDFDEQTARFEVARFSLHKLLNGLVSRSDISAVEHELGTQSEVEQTLSRRGIVVFGNVHGDIYSAEQAVAIGPNASVSNARVIIDRSSDR